VYVLLHFIFTQALDPMLSPAQLLFRYDASGFWQNRVRRWTPVPHVVGQLSHSDQCVHPTDKKKSDISFNKTEAAVFSCRLCFLGVFPFVSLSITTLCFWLVNCCITSTETCKNMYNTDQNISLKWRDVQRKNVAVEADMVNGQSTMAEWPLN